MSTIVKAIRKPFEAVGKYLQKEDEFCMGVVLSYGTLPLPLIYYLLIEQSAMSADLAWKLTIGMPALGVALIADASRRGYRLDGMERDAAAAARYLPSKD